MCHTFGEQSNSTIAIWHTSGSNQTQKLQFDILWGINQTQQLQISCIAKAFISVTIVIKNDP